jgi:hypothetical protein
MAAASCQLGDLRWRVNPTNISWNYQLDTAVIETLGGQVVQILGATLGDLTISGDFGQKWISATGKGSSADSWELANAFHTKIKGMMDAQSSIPFIKGSGAGRTVKAEQAFVHKPYAFTYSDDLHTWNFKVLIKAIADADGDGSSISYSNGKYNQRYQLTLFIVQADSDVVKTIASDAFIARIAKGIGWRKSGGFHGSVTAQQAQDIILANGGTISQMLAQTLGGQPIKIPASTTPPTSSRKSASDSSRGVGRGVRAI